jgi:tRNA threonylcarbamoyladenosine biosynthesis protein TsaE
MSDTVHRAQMSRSVAETVALGARLGAAAAGGTCVLLGGTLGAGKTQLVRGIAAGARVADPGLVSSPTYVLLNIYPRSADDAQSKTVYHIDAYRTHGSEDCAALGLDELLADAEALVVIEWPERIAELWPAERLEITLEIEDETTRRLTITGVGARAADIVGRL